jgi:hypothetical protein
MAQDDAAQPLLDIRNKLIDYARKAKEWGESGTKNLDTTWHDEMVRKANESFQKDAEKKKIVKKPVQSAGTRKKPTTSKPIYRKRVAGKQ